MDIEALLHQDSLFPTSLNKILEGFSAQLRDPLLQVNHFLQLSMGVIFISQSEDVVG